MRIVFFVILMDTCIHDRSITLYTSRVWKMSGAPVQTQLSLNITILFIVVIKEYMYVTHTFGLART